MTERRYAFTQPTNSMLRWLTDPGPSVPPDVGSLLLGELFASPKAVLIGGLNAVVLDVFALIMNGGPAFGVFIMLEIVLATVRTSVVNRAVLAASRNAPTPTDLYLVCALAWCALQGATAFAAMQSDIVPLQLLSGITVMALAGPICARNYAALRYASTLVGLCHLPFVAGALLSKDHWLRILVPQLPMLFFGALMTLRRFQAMAVATLLAEQESSHHARHDALTGLLNRHGLTAKLEHCFAAPDEPFIVFYLDLDGFKSINDRFGHQAGDLVLQSVAGRLRDATGGRDIISRLGGDEFVIIAPDLTADEGACFAEQVIRRIANEPYVFEATGPLHIGVSIGFACAPDDGLPGRDLLQKADAALYEAKAAGKGVQRRFTPAPPARPHQSSPASAATTARHAA